MILKFNPMSSKLGLKNGHLTINGQCLKRGQAMNCRVRLFDKFSGILIDDVATDQSGNYTFSGLAQSKYIVVASDPASEFNAVIQDNVVPK